jgi:hypothetical protein
VSTQTTDANGQITELTDTATVLQASAPRTPGGLVASTTETGAAGAPAQRFSYDGAQRLSAAGPDATRPYAYDAADNPTGLPGGKAQRFDAANQLTKITAQGGLVETADGGVDGGVYATDQTRASYGYDQADQLPGPRQRTPQPERHARNRVTTPRSSLQNPETRGGRASAKGIFRNRTRGQRVEQSSLGAGGVRRRAGDGTQIRLNPDGSTRIDLEHSDGRETIHFDP